MKKWKDMSSLEKQITQEWYDRQYRLVLVKPVLFEAENVDDQLLMSIQLPSPKKHKMIN